MKPITFPEVNRVYAEDQPKYLPLPVHVNEMGLTTSCWQLTWRERIKVLFTGVMWFDQHTFNQPLQPQRPYIDCELVKRKENK